MRAFLFCKNKFGAYANLHIFAVIKQQTNKLKINNMKTIKLNLELMTFEQMLEDEARLYNEYEWKKKLNRYKAYGAQFYKVPQGDGYDYDRFFVIYTVEEGITFFGQFDYHSVLSSSGFLRVEVDVDNGELKLFGFGANGDSRASNCKENRKQFAVNSKHNSHIFTNCF